MKVIRVISVTGCCRQDCDTDIEDNWATGTRDECLKAIKDDIKYHRSCEPDSGSVLVSVNNEYVDEDGYMEYEDISVDDYINAIDTDKTVIRLQSDDVYSSVYEFVYKIVKN